MNKSWGIGAWAAEAEREEAEAAAAAAAAAPMEAFPTLGESLSAKPKKKKQQQTFSLAELTIGKSVAPGSRSRSMPDSRGLTAEEMMMLPTAPRDRSSEDEQRAGLGGAFRDYRDFNRMDRGAGFGGGFEHDREGGGFLRDRDRDRDEPLRADDSSNWSSFKKPAFSGGFDGERRGSRLSGVDRELLPPSRADEVDNWGLAKKYLPLAPSDARRRDKFDDSEQHSRADGANTWASSKKPLPPPPPRLGTMSGHDVMHAHSRADEADNWSLSKKIPATETRASGHNPHMQEVGANSEGRWGRRTDIGPPQVVEESQRRRLVIAPRSSQSSPPVPGFVGDVKSVPPIQPKFKPDPFGSARPRENVLADRGHALQGSKNEQDSRPSSSHSSRPVTPEVGVEPTVSARPKINPFGNAKPREVLLQERGKDWRKMDFDYEHRGVDRPETGEEMLLKEEIKDLTELSNVLKETDSQQMNGLVTDQSAESQNYQRAGDQHSRLHLILEELRSKEKQLEVLVRILDDRVRFSQKVGDRPGSRSGRSDSGRSYDMSERPGSRQGSRPSSRPSSRSGLSDAGRNYDLVERPGSQPGRRNFDSSESSHSHVGYGRGRVMQPVERWSRGEGNISQDPLEMTVLWGGSSDGRQSFEHRAAPVPTEVGGTVDYSQEVGGPDIWTRSNHEPGWGERERVHASAGMRSSKDHGTRRF